MKPPYSITPVILKLLSIVSEKIGEINASHLQRPKAELRKDNRIKTIQSSLEIEGNTLSVEQVTAILENKRVLAPQKDILEVKNAIAVYDSIVTFKPYSLTSFLSAHRLLMTGLVPSPGKLRSGNVGIVKGDKLAHLAPQGTMAKPLMNDLFAYVKRDDDPLLIKSCVFHYELEFIHPFADGNGRMGRLWQTVLLMQQYPVFEYLPVESIIKKKQAEYYKSLGQSDKEGHCTRFIEFMLLVISEALEALLVLQPVSLQGNDRIAIFKTQIGQHLFTRQDYMRAFKEISSATASRDLSDAVINKILVRSGDKRTTVYQFQ
ncbi:Fic family protein [Asinibacterium sp. OR53]|uniref:Fic family protein n=1 Tax=Asinibacterium sp. OR53 TaxID=925409 RepID=UPI00047BA388|nr:Fic family protein [Asinibacterium sp. OR53]